MRYVTLRYKSCVRVGSETCGSSSIYVVCIPATTSKGEKKKCWYQQAAGDLVGTKCGDCGESYDKLIMQEVWKLSNWTEVRTA